MVTKKQSEDGWTNIRLKRDTLRRLRISKAILSHPFYDETINEALDLLEEKIK